MSGPQARPFKGRLGFDANNDKVVNLADPTQLQDGVNLRYFIATNTTQTFDPTRGYPAGFIVEYGDRLFKSKTTIAIGAFNLNDWTEVHAFGRWLRVTGAYTADPGDNLYVSTSAASVTIKLPFPAEDGDIVTILDEGFAKTNPIVVDAQTNTINNILGNYSINSQDICQFIYLGGTWKVSREEKSTFQYVSTNATVTPNSFNIVDTSSARTVTLPVAPIQGQWVTVVDGSNQAAVNNITVAGNGTLINGSASFVLRRYAEQATFVYDSASTSWKAVTNALEGRILETLTPLPSQSVSVALDGTNKAMTLPVSVTGDWVEVVSTVQDTVAVGSLVVTAPGATYFRNNGGTQNTTTYRIKRRGKTLFILKGNEWSVIHTENGMTAAANLTSGSMVKNTLLTLTGSASSTISLPASDSVQVGDYVTCQLNSSVGRVLVSVQNTGTDLLDAATTATYQAVDNGVVVTFIYRGWNGTKYVWETLNHGSAFLKKSENLNDLSDKSVARFNLDVFSKGESDLRFLPLHGTADNALQAVNSDKLDGLHGSEYIQVKNPSLTAVDANTTTETRFTTNTNTPDATMWQVVMFLDTATSAKSQIAMNITTNQIAYRVYDGSVWAAWSRLDQAGVVDSALAANKLATPRYIYLGDDASGGIQFDGSANVTIPVSGVLASRLKPVATTTNASTTNLYTKFATVNIPATADKSLQLKFIGMPRKTTSGPAGIYSNSEVEVRIRGGFVTLAYTVNSAFGSSGGGIGHEIGYVITGDVVDLYVKTVTTNLSITFHEIARHGSSEAVVTWLSSQTQSATEPAGIVYGAFNRPYVDAYHPLADKLSTPRSIALSGGVTGTATFDGSGDITINTTVNGGGISIPISSVNSLQTELDNKLSTTGKAADSDMLDGFDGLDYKKTITGVNSGEDPNTTIIGNILTNHTNTPDAGDSYWYVETQFYQTRDVASNRFQFAYQYNGGNSVQFRNCVSGVWSAWAAISAIVDGNTYNINISGHATTSTLADQLNTSRTINGVPFNGSANIVVADDTKLPLAGGYMTGQIKRLRSGQNLKTYDSVLSETVASNTTGTLRIKLPVGMQNTMMTFDLNVFNMANNTSTTFHISGYNYSAGWTALTVTADDSNATQYGDTVRFGYDGTNAVILIGTTASTWQYPAVSISSVVLSYSGAVDASWENAWVGGFITTETGFTGVVSAQISQNVAKLQRANLFTQPQTINTGAANASYLRNITGNYGVFLYQDASAWYIMKTASGDQSGTFDATRPFAITLSTGAVTLGTAVTMSSNATVGGTLGVTGVLTTTAQANLSGGSTAATWYRSTGSVGWFNDTYGGGIYMIDATWVRIYGSKALYVANEIAATGNITAYYSDARLKENLKVIPSALDTVKSWTGYTYNANVTAQSFGYDPQKKEIGLLAQDVQKTTPEAVEQAPFDRTSVKGKSLTGKNYLTLKYDRLVPVLVEAIKEQDRKVEDQGREIQELKAQIKGLIELINSK